MIRHLLALRDLEPAQIEHLLDLAQACASGNFPLGAALRGRTVMTLFYEPSTRTEISFEIAARRLGAEVARCDVERSSVRKGESLIDTGQTLEALGASAVVLRHPSAGAPHLLSRWVRCAVINAGDGMHEHPTQGLIDLLTARQVKGCIAGLRVAIVGDILHSRVARSAVWGFTRLGATVTLVGPTPLLPVHPEALPARLTSSLEEALDGADVIMALRMQLERQRGGSVPSLSEYTRRYAITTQALARAHPQAILMHPGPMNLGVEIHAEAAYGSRSVIRTQVTNGGHVRMAALLWALGLDTADARSTQSTRPTRSARSKASLRLPGRPRSTDAVHAVQLTPWFSANGEDSAMQEDREDRGDREDRVDVFDSVVRG